MKLTVAVPARFDDHHLGNKLNESRGRYIIIFTSRYRRGIPARQSSARQAKSRERALWRRRHANYQERRAAFLGAMTERVYSNGPALT